MHGDWKGAFSRRLQKRASERGRRMAKARWDRDRERRNRLAALAPEQYPARIVKRIVVIWNEREARETVIYESDSASTARRKEKEVLRAG